MGGNQSSKESKEDSVSREIDILRKEQKELEYLAKLTHFSQSTLKKLNKRFLQISKSVTDDDTIDKDEFALALGLDPDSLLVNRFFQRFDKTEMGGLTFREFTMTLSVLSSHASDEQKIRFSFDLYDLNRDGVLDEGELKQLVNSALAASGVYLTENHIQRILDNTLHVTDTDQNGTIEYEEYFRLVKENPRLLDPYTIKIEQILDQNKDGVSSSPIWDSTSGTSLLASGSEKRGQLTHGLKKSSPAHKKSRSRRVTSKMRKLAARPSMVHTVADVDELPDD